MNTHKPNRSGAFRSAATWAGTAALALGGLFGASGAFAAPAPANTLIGNQAVAGYVDSTGNPQSASSNLVQTKVQQVGSFTLISDNTKSAAGGNTVYASHTLTTINTGNAQGKIYASTYVRLVDRKARSVSVALSVVQSIFQKQVNRAR